MYKYLLVSLLALAAPAFSDEGKTREQKIIEKAKPKVKKAITRVKDKVKKWSEFADTKSTKSKEKK